MVSSTPELGQLVEVRRRQWIVARVDASAISQGNTQHLVTLSSVDDDALGEELEVIWELEPGARIRERAGLPSMSGYDDAERLNSFLDAVRWGAATNADRDFLQAPFRSGIKIEDYQLDPLVRSLGMTRSNLLIADDVGLGKTIEAGLIIQEMLVRHRARSVWIVCPASLQIKWKDEMQEKFGLEFRIADTEYVRRLRRERGVNANPWTSYPRLIASMDWAKGGEPLRLLKEALPPEASYPRKFDILVIDEAHNVSPSMATHYSVESQRTRLARTLVPHFEHRLFLSATPHNGYTESFTSLLELLDDQRFARNVEPDDKHLQRVMVRRLKQDIRDTDGKATFAKRSIKALETAYSDDERRIHQLLEKYIASRSATIKQSGGRKGSDFIHVLLKKRLFSSPRAFASTLSKYRDGLEGKRKQKKKSALDERILAKAISRTEEEYADDIAYEEAIGEAVDEIVGVSEGLTEDEQTQLDVLTAWAEAAQNQMDSKASAIIEWLEEHLRPGGEWNGERVILFTEWMPTFSWLQEILASHNFGGERLMYIHGGVTQEERQKVTNAFQASPEDSPVRILLATDAASEGIDLQNHCRFMIHVEIPWNPNVLEQRNGRIDRFGQKYSEVLIWHPVGKGFHKNEAETVGKVGGLEGDQEYLMRVAHKVEAIRQDLGSVGPVLAQQIQEVMLGRRTTIDTIAVEQKAKAAKKHITAEKQLGEKIGRLHERLMEARNDFYLVPERIAKTVEVGLELAEKPPLKAVDLVGAPPGTVFEVPILTGSWGDDTIGLIHPHTEQRRPITFDPEVSGRRDDVVLAHLNHRLVQRCLRILRAEVWSPEEEKRLHRFSVRSSADSSIKEPTLVLYSRLAITGGNHSRLHEELTLSGGELRSNGFSRIPQVGRLQEMLDQSIPFIPSQKDFRVLAGSYERAGDSILAAVEARSKDRLRSLENTLERRKKADVANTENLLTELEILIARAIEDTKEIQTELWQSETEKMQVRRDVAALSVRLKQIPKEKAAETEAIAKRYSDLAHRTFPVAAILILPADFANGGSGS